MECRLRRKNWLGEKENVVEMQHFSSRSGSPEGCLVIVLVGWYILAFLCRQYNAIILTEDGRCFVQLWIQVTAQDPSMTWLSTIATILYSDIKYEPGIT